MLAGRCRCSDVEEVSVRGEWAAVPFVWEALRGCSVECERASDAFTAVSRGLTPCRPCGHLLGTVQALAVHLQKYGFKEYRLRILLTLPRSLESKTSTGRCLHRRSGSSRGTQGDGLPD